MPLTYRHYFLISIGLLALLQASVALAATPVEPGKVTVYRCVDTKGKVSLQDSPCAKTSQQETREMIRPKDAPPSKKIFVRAPMPAPPPVQPTDGTKWPTKKKVKWGLVAWLFLAFGYYLQTGESDSALGAVVMLAFLIWDPFKWFVPKA